MAESIRVSLSRNTVAGGSLPALAFAASTPQLVLGNKRKNEYLVRPIQATDSTCFGPRSACLTSVHGPLWICDTGHNRLLGWKCLPDSDGEPATWVIGQSDFLSEARNGNGEGTATSLHVPTGVCTAGGALVVCDSWNHRILIWNKIPESSNASPDVVLGQPDFTKCAPNRGNDQPDADTLHWPYSAAYLKDKLVVSDTGNRRVLIWNGLPTQSGQPADLVLGQNSFQKRDENGGDAACARSMRWPHGITSLENGLCVADAGNNRIMIWRDLPSDSNSPCDLVLGQNNFASIDHNKSRYEPGNDSLNMPYGIASHDHWLIAADTANSRLTAWHADQLATGAAAVALLGQESFQQKGENRWLSMAADSFCWPYGVQVIDGLLVVADTGNSRVSIWRLTV